MAFTRLSSTLKNLELKNFRFVFFQIFAEKMRVASNPTESGREVGLLTYEARRVIVTLMKHRYMIASIARAPGECTGTRLSARRLHLAPT